MRRTGAFPKGCVGSVRSDRVDDGNGTGSLPPYYAQQGRGGEMRCVLPRTPSGKCA